LTSHRFLSMIRIAWEEQHHSSINEQWRVLLTRYVPESHRRLPKCARLTRDRFVCRLSLAEDFQALQLFKLTEARLRSKGLAMDEVRCRSRRIFQRRRRRPLPPLPPSQIRLVSPRPLARAQNACADRHGPPHCRSSLLGQHRVRSQRVT
jgi:hypothetical protein